MQPALHIPNNTNGRLKLAASGAWEMKAAMKWSSVSEEMRNDKHLKTDKFSVQTLCLASSGAWGFQLHTCTNIAWTPQVIFPPKTRLVASKTKVFSFAKIIYRYFIVEKCHLFSLTHSFSLHSLCAGQEQIKKWLVKAQLCKWGNKRAELGQLLQHLLLPCTV